MHLRAPLRSLCSDNHGRVLTILADADEPLAGNAIATRAGMSRNAVLRVLDDLVAAGIVWRARLHTRWSLHILDPEHLLVPALLDLVDIGPRLLARVAAHVEDWTPPPATVAFRMPAAEGAEEDGDGVVELLVAVDDAALLDDPAWAERVETLVQGVRRWTGNDVHLIHASAAGLDQRAAGGGADTDEQTNTDGAAWLLAAGRPVGPATAGAQADTGRPDHGEQESARLPGWPEGSRT